jgi:hypothetical protein
VTVTVTSRRAAPLPAGGDPPGRPAGRARVAPDVTGLGARPAGPGAAGPSRPPGGSGCYRRGDRASASLRTAGRDGRGNARAAQAGDTPRTREESLESPPTDGRAGPEYPSRRTKARTRTEL